MGLLSSIVNRTRSVTRLRAKCEDLSRRYRATREQFTALRQENKNLRAMQGFPMKASTAREGELRTALADLVAQDTMVCSLAGVEEMVARVSLAVADADIMLKKSSGLHYLRAGFSALDSIQRAAGDVHPSSVLDFGCGYGRVLRFFKAAWPDAAVTVCDLMPDGLAFCMEHFDVCGFRSKVEPVMPSIAHRFDLIWAGSVITHLPADKVRGFITLWRDLLLTGGRMVFTSHGTLVHERLSARSFLYDLTDEAADRVLYEYKSSGFGYADYATTKGYGVSLNSEAWMRAQVEGLGGLGYVKFIPRLWDNHQDVWCFERVS